MALRAETTGRRLIEAWRSVRRLPQRPALTGTDWMPLADAAMALRAVYKNSDLDRISRGLSESDENLLAFWAYHVAKSGVPVYGFRIMTSQPVPVSEAEMRGGKLLNQASRLERSQGQPIRDICALQVRRGDLEVALAQAETSPAIQ